MIIKRFQGKTEIDAIEAAKKEMGQNVVVMNVKNVKKKGFAKLLFFQPNLIEATVALEEESERQPARKIEPRAFSTDIIPEEALAPEKSTVDVKYNE